MKKATILAGWALIPAIASAAPTLQVVNRGTPSDGVQTLSGFYTVTVRVVSPDAPISGIRISSGSGALTGGLLQRWEDPKSQSHYAITSPGFSLAQNVSVDTLSLDTHFLGNPVERAIVSSLAEDGGFAGFQQRTNLVSTPSVGYGVTSNQPITDPFSLAGAGHLYGGYNILPAFQSDQLDVLYIVSDGIVSNTISVITPLGVTDLSYTIILPEPSGIASVIYAGVMFLRRRRKTWGKPHPTRLRADQRT